MSSETVVYHGSTTNPKCDFKRAVQATVFAIKVNRLVYFLSQLKSCISAASSATCNFLMPLLPSTTSKQFHLLGCLSVTGRNQITGNWLLIHRWWLWWNGGGEKPSNKFHNATWAAFLSKETKCTCVICSVILLYDSLIKQCDVYDCY